jgi:hypothetical protein
MIAIGRADLLLTNKGSERSLSWVQGWTDGDVGMVLRSRYHMSCTPMGHTMRAHTRNSERTTCSAAFVNQGDERLARTGGVAIGLRRHDARADSTRLRASAGAQAN